MRTITLLLILIVKPALSFAGNGLYVGIIEHFKMCGKKQADIASRILFQKVGDRWKALGTIDSKILLEQQYLKSTVWTIAFDGKNIGKVKLINSDSDASYINDWYYRRDKIYSLSSKYSIPKIKNTTKSFTSWCRTPDFRPLVIVSKNNFKDPDKWKRFEPKDSYKKLLYPYLRVVVGRLNFVRCIYDQTYDFVPYEYMPKDTVIYKGYRSLGGEELITLGINLSIANCDGPIDPEWSGNLFLLDRDHVDFIGSQIELIDAGDYDGDGESELLFWFSGYNKDGYVLIYDNFRRKAEYLWSYH